MAASNFSREDPEKPKEEKEPSLKLDEMIPIFRRLPTSEHIRFISNAPKHPLGQFWSHGLKFVVEKRLPLLLLVTVAQGSNGESVTSHVIYDRNGSKVADIKQPEYFHLSPLCELIEAVWFPFRFPATSRCTPLRFFRNLNALTLSFSESAWAMNERIRDCEVTFYSELLSQPQITSLSLSSGDASNFDGDQRIPRFYFDLSGLLARAGNLKKLSANEGQFFALLPGNGGRAPATTATVLAGLESLSIVRGRRKEPQQALQFISTHCTNLRELNLPLRGDVGDYFAAFQTLPQLSKLGLDAGHNRPKIAIDRNAATVASVTEFRFSSFHIFCNEPALLLLLSKLPNVRVFEMQSCKPLHMLQFATAVCSSGVLRNLESLKCSRGIGPSNDDAILSFISASNSNLPANVDLSQLDVQRPPSGGEFLADIYRAIEANTVATLLIKAVVRQVAVDRLREYLASVNKKHAELGENLGKMLAWKNEEISVGNLNNAPLGQLSQFTDFKIEGFKTSGPSKGAAFKVRISRQ